MARSVSLSYTMRYIFEICDIEHKGKRGLKGLTVGMELEIIARAKEKEQNCEYGKEWINKCLFKFMDFQIFIFPVETRELIIYFSQRFMWGYSDRGLCKTGYTCTYSWEGFTNSWRPMCHCVR